MQEFTLAQLLKAVNGKLLGEFSALDTVITQVDTDSRTISGKGSLFVPLKGERFDGHVYLDAALEAGADGCLTAEERPIYRADKFYVRVRDTQRALRDLAAWYKSRFPIPFIAVTGSVGKTTAKDMIAAVLGRKFKVLKTDGNYNNNIGLPLTLFRLAPEHQFGVVEMGMDRFGEIDYLSGIVKPDVGIITNIGDAHIERLGSRENIFKAKCELLPHVKRDGLLILNGDDKYLSTLKGRTETPCIFCGAGENLSYHAKVVGGDGTSYILCRITTPSMEREFRIPALGDHMIYPALFAAAVAEWAGLSPDEIQEGFAQFVPTQMRMNVLRRADKITILDDTYNANPQSMRAAIRVLAGWPSKCKIAVLGDMLELGPFAPALHEEVGETLGASGIDCVVAVGDMACHIADGAERAGVGRVYRCLDQASAKQVLEDELQPDCAILVKASRAMKLEDITAFLKTLTGEKEPRS